MRLHERERGISEVGDMPDTRASLRGVAAFDRERDAHHERGRG